jgi:hypothetical protein
VSATITSSGKALVTITGGMSFPFSNSTGTVQGNIGFAVSGATTLAASDAQSLMLSSGVNAAASNTIGAQMSATYLVTGLTAGSNTFTLQYKTSGDTVTFVNRNIIVIPIP